MALDQFLALLGWIVLWALVIGVLFVLLLRMLRRSSIVIQICLVVLATIGVLVAAMVGASNAMFLDASQIELMLYILGAASIAALVVAIILGTRVSRYTMNLSKAAQRIGQGETVILEQNYSSELAQLAAELQRASEKLEESRLREAAMESARQELVSWVSHDLRTPLASMKAMTEALEDGVVTDISGYHRKILMQADQMSVLINDLLELSKIHSGSLSVKSNKIDLYDLISEVIADVTPLAVAKEIAINGEGVQTVILEADGALLARMVRNLVVNAISYSPEGSTVTITTGQQGKSVSIKVQDECGGIESADITRLFEMGWRKSPERSSSPYSGAGVGLATVQGIVAAHQGEVSVHNYPLGCVFTVELPITMRAESTQGHG